ncbi:MFS transporter [Streptomyces sp. NPDC058299]|uniref:MFS transporter n=1 Tax=Streptomyces sp. NPDC058299 TaxID=3346435 RepID=UPI0036EE9876
MTSPDTSAPADTRPPDPPDAATAGPVVPLHRDRHFLLLGGSAVSLLGSTATTIACLLLVVALTGSPFAAGPAGFVALLPALLLPLPAALLLPLRAGALVDRWPRGRLMIRSDAPRALGAATVAVTATLGVLGLPLVLAVSFAEGVLTVFHGFAAHAAVPNVVPPGQLSPAVSRNEAPRRATVMPGIPGRHRAGHLRRRVLGGSGPDGRLRGGRGRPRLAGGAVARPPRRTGRPADRGEPGGGG